MRFDRFPRYERVKVTPQRMAAARRAVARDREQCGLFPELMQFQTAEQRIKANLASREVWLLGRRDQVASSWRRARARLRRLGPSQRRGLLRYWSAGVYPGAAHYLAGMITDTERGRCWWHALAVRRRLALIGLGKWPRREGQTFAQMLGG